MNALVLLLAVAIPFPLCWFRMKRYHIPLWKMLLIYIVVSVVGALGAAVGALVSNETILAKRLYGLVLFDTGLLLLLSPILKIPMDDLGDFVAVPIMAVCFASKIDCLVKGCCYGFSIYQWSDQEVLRFPSAMLEMLIWGVMTILLLRIEHLGKKRGLLWPIGMIWFGLARFLVDFLRGSALERRIYTLGLTAGQFWSLVVLAVGAVYLWISLYRKLHRAPNLQVYAKAAIGV